MTLFNGGPVLVLPSRSSAFLHESVQSIPRRPCDSMFRKVDRHVQQAANQVFALDTQPLTRIRPITPYTALQEGMCTLLYENDYAALSEFRRTNELPRDLSAGSAFRIIAHAEHFHECILRKKAFDSLISSFVHKRDSVFDYCQALWLVAQSYDIPCLQGIQEQIRSPESPFHPAVAPWMKLSETEKLSLFEILSKRSVTECTKGLGPLRFTELKDFLEDFGIHGKIVRHLLHASQDVTLRLTRFKDAGYLLNTVIPNSINGVFHPQWVKDFNETFWLKISKVEYLSKKRANPQIDSAIKMFEATSTIVCTPFITDYPERFKNKKNEVSVTPWLQNGTYSSCYTSIRM